MMKKIVLLILSSFFSILLASASTNQKAIDYYQFDLTKSAKNILLGNLKNNQMSATEKAEAYYYLGEISFIEQKNDSAAFYYNKGISIDPIFLLNNVGKAKLLLKTQPLEAEKEIALVLSGKNKKNIELQVAVARAYFVNNMIAKATSQLNEAKKINSKSPLVYVLEGDLAALNKDYGNACNLYEQAIYFDSKCKEAYVKYARVYTKINMPLAIDKLQQLINLEPNSFLPYREMGEIYYQNGQFSKAASSYEKYFKNDVYSYDDYPKYASILFFNGDFNKSLEIVQQALKADPTSFILNRLLMYNYYQLKKYQEGILVGDQLMSGSNTNEFIALDYAFYARLLSENNRKQESVVAFEKAIAMDSTKVDLYKELASVYESLSQYDNAIASYNAFIQKGGDAVKVNDYFLLGKCNYSAATDTALTKSPENDLKKIEYCKVADSLFNYLAVKVPESYLGNLWRARTNSVLDPETEKGLSKPYYEAALTLLDKNNPKDIKPIVECYSYLGYYYYVKKDITKSKSYWNQILELDPTNQTAKKALEGM